jgi:hypothetical protein
MDLLKQRVERLETGVLYHRERVRVLTNELMEAQTEYIRFLQENKGAAQASACDPNALHDEECEGCT